MRSYAYATLVILVFPLALLLAQLVAVGQQTPPGPLDAPGVASPHLRGKNEVRDTGPIEFHIDLDIGKTYSAVPPGLRKRTIAEMIVELLKDQSNQTIVDAVKRSLAGPVRHIAVLVQQAHEELPPSGPPLPGSPEADEVRSLDGGRKLKKGEVDVVVRVGSPDSDSTNGPYRVQIRVQLSPTPTRSEYDRIIRLIRTKIVDDLPDYSQRYLKQELTWGEKREAELNRLQVARDMAFLSPVKVDEQLATFGQQQTAARLSLVGMDARAKALAEEIKRTESQARDHAESDEVLVSLARLLALREQQVERIKTLQARNSVTQQEVQHAEADMLSAKIEYAKRREALLRNSGGDRLSTLNDELNHVSIERAETMARLKYLEETSASMARVELHLRETNGDNRPLNLYGGIAEIERIDRESKELRQLKAVQGMTFGPVRVVLPPDNAEATGEAKK